MMISAIKPDVQVSDRKGWLYRDLIQYLIQQGALRSNSPLLYDVFRIKSTTAPGQTQEKEFLEDLMTQLLMKVGNDPDDLKSMASFIIAVYKRSKQGTGYITPKEP